MDKPVELLMFDFLTERFAAAASDSVLAGVELHDTVWQSIETGRCVRISDAVSSMVPSVGGIVQEYDGTVIIACCSRVDGKNQKARAAALQDVFKIQTAVVQLLMDDESLGNRVCNVRVEAIPRSYDNLDGKPFAVANIPVKVNPID